MRKNILLCSALLGVGLFLVGCGTGSTAETETELPPAVETVDEAKRDHPILDDYLTVVPSGEHEVELLFANVGKADAMLLEVDGMRYMIDTGTTDSVPQLLTAMAAMEWDALDGLFVTHSHNDHVGGADELCTVYPVGNYYTAAISMDMSKLTAPAVLHGIPHTILEPGTCVSLADGVYFEVYAPYRYNPLDENNNSLVLMLRVNGVSVLLASDMLFDEEKTLFKQDYDLSADILKVGHHGRKDATSTKFIAAVAPKAVVISTDSEEEPPHSSILNAFEARGAEIYVTEDYDVGISLSIQPDGSYTFKNAEISKGPAADLTLVSVSKGRQSVTLRNEGDAPVDLTRYFLFSERGSEIFVFPEGTVLEADAELTVACTGSTVPGDLTWEESRVWNKNKEDRCFLYDCYGNLLDDKPSE